MTSAQGRVVSVSRNETYGFSKPVRAEITLVAGTGVEGDAHAGVHVKHRYRVRADPSQPNLRQVHLIHQELFAEVGAKGYPVLPGELGENVTTSGIDLVGLPVGTILRFGPPQAEEAAGAADESGAAVAELLAVAEAAVLDAPTAAAARAVAAAAARDAGRDRRAAVVVAGLRNPCSQINRFQPGLLKEVIGRDAGGALVRKGGVMAVVLRGGLVRPGDALSVDLPPAPHAPLDLV